MIIRLRALAKDAALAAFASAKPALGAEPAAGRPALDYRAPDGWQKAAPSAMSVASFQVTRVTGSSSLWANAGAALERSAARTAKRRLRIAGAYQKRH